MDLVPGGTEKHGCLELYLSVVLLARQIADSVRWTRRGGEPGDPGRDTGNRPKNGNAAGEGGSCSHFWRDGRWRRERVIASRQALGRGGKNSTRESSRYGKARSSH